jgi:hypothetical protein
VERVVVRRENDDLAKRTHEVDEAVLVLEGGRREEPFRVLRAETERTRTVVDGEDTNPVATERANCGEPVHPAHVDHCSRNAHARLAKVVQRSQILG